MTTTVLEPAGVAPALTQVPASLFKRIDQRAREIVYWGLMGFGVVFPILGTIVGLVRTQL